VRSKKKNKHWRTTSMMTMEERRETLEKRWHKYMRNMMMINMQRMMGAQTLMIGDPAGMHAGMGAIREELDDRAGSSVGASFPRLWVMAAEECPTGCSV
jgi:hypothetical protein